MLVLGRRGAGGGVPGQCLDPGWHRPTQGRALRASHSNSSTRGWRSSRSIFKACGKRACACSGWQRRAGAAFDLEDARSHYNAILKYAPDDVETWALLGRVEKDAWVSCWFLPDASAKQRIEEARYEDALLKAAIECYETAFRSDPKHYYSGINALALMHLYEHLTAKDSYRHVMQVMAGAVRFAAECEDKRDKEKLYWARATLGDLEVLIGTPESTEAAYKDAVAINRGNWFALNSSRDQLLLLQQLDFRQTMWPQASRFLIVPCAACLTGPEMGAKTGVAVQWAHGRCPRPRNTTFQRRHGGPRRSEDC